MNNQSMIAIMQTNKMEDLMNLDQKVYCKFLRLSSKNSKVEFQEPHARTLCQQFEKWFNKLFCKATDTKVKNG